MRNPSQIRAALLALKNVKQFCTTNGIPERTVFRLRAGGTARRGTLVQIELALNRVKQ